MSTPDPQTIGRYQVVQRLGAGAMGVVYLCQDPLLKRKVAVKTVKAGHGNSEAILARFQRESEISAQLNHPNIITVFDVGNDEGIGPYLTMELVDGGSLASLINDEPMDPRQAIQLLAQGAQALVAAEQGGVVHRDVKPENILVSKDGRLKLTDFGVARDESSTLTTTGVVMGTPTHTAPELLAGSLANPGTDRYAFGVMAYQMFTGGGLPHPGETISSVLTHIVNELPVIPDTMPPPAARAFLKALHKDPTRRYETLLAFLEALSEAYGVRDALSTAGLSPRATPLPSESGTREVTRSGAGDARSATGGARNTPASSRASGEGIQTQAPASAKLMGPPTDLLRAGKKAESEDPTGPHEPLAASQIEMMAGSRIGVMRPEATHRLKSRPSGDSERQMRLVMYLLAVVAVLVGWSWYNARTPEVSSVPMSVSVITEPKGASVIIDNNSTGLTTPIYAYELPSGQHEVLITLDGYETYSTFFSPKKPLPATISLKPKPKDDADAGPGK